MKGHVCLYLYRHWKSELVRNGKPSLSRALLKTIWWRLIISNLGMASQVSFTVLVEMEPLTTISRFPEKLLGCTCFVAHRSA